LIQISQVTGAKAGDRRGRWSERDPITLAAV
jgi:hypothetical protein